MYRFFSDGAKLHKTMFPLAPKWCSSSLCFFWATLRPNPLYFARIDRSWRSFIEFYSEPPNHPNFCTFLKRDGFVLFCSHSQFRHALLINNTIAQGSLPSFFQVFEGANGDPGVECTCTNFHLYAHTCIGVLRTGAHSHIYTQKDGWVGGVDGWMDGWMDG